MIDINNARLKMIEKQILFSENQNNHQNVEQGPTSAGHFSLDFMKIFSQLFVNFYFLVS